MRSEAPLHLNSSTLKFPKWSSPTTSSSPPTASGSPTTPGGSWSDFIHSWELALHGQATKTTTRTSIANKSHNHAQRQRAKSALKYPPVNFTGLQCRAISLGLANAITRSHFILHACSLLPTHMHLVLARPRYSVEKARTQLKGEAAKSLRAENLHPFPHPLPNGKLHSPFAQKGWDVYLNTPEDIRRSINYVYNNPIKENKRPQHWPFITPYPIPPRTL